MDDFSDSLIKATDLELTQRDRYVKAFADEYRATHPLEPFAPATFDDIGMKALVAHIATAAINLTTAGATGTVFYFLELEVLAKEFGVNVTNPAVMTVSGILALAAVMGIDFALTSSGLTKGESDEKPYSDRSTHYAAGVTAGMAGVFRGLLYFQIVPQGSAAETIIKTLVMLAIAVLPVLILYPAARISGYWLGWVYNENRRRQKDYKKIEKEWKHEYQEALKNHISARVSTAATLQRRMGMGQPQVQVAPQQTTAASANAAHIRQAFDQVLATSSDPLVIRPDKVRKVLLKSGLSVNDNSLRPTIVRVRAEHLNTALMDMDSSPFQSKQEIVERLSAKFGRQISIDEITDYLHEEMKNKFARQQQQLQ